MMKPWNAVGLVAVALGILGCSGAENLVDAGDSTPAKLTADETPTGAAGDVFYVKFETTKGDVIIEVHPEWAPNGAKHFKELVDMKFYDGCKFFRVLKDPKPFMAQVGMSGDPKVQAEWGEKTIQDDPVKRSNVRGFVTYAQSSQRNSRSTQIFFNYGDNSFLDGQRFAPFALVVAGMPVLDSLYGDYGEGAPSGRGPSQGGIAQGGNEYLEAKFPKLDAIKTARIIDKSEVDALKAKE